MWRKGWKRKAEGDSAGHGEASHSRKFPKRDSEDGGGEDGITVCEVWFFAACNPRCLFLLWSRCRPGFLRLIYGYWIWGRVVDFKESEGFGAAVAGERRG